MKRALAVIRSPWFLIGVGLSDIALGLVELGMQRRRDHAWDKAIKDEQEKAKPDGVSEEA